MCATRRVVHMEGVSYSSVGNLRTRRAVHTFTVCAGKFSPRGKSRALAWLFGIHSEGAGAYRRYA